MTAALDHRGRRRGRGTITRHRHHTRGEQPKNATMNSSPGRGTGAPRGHPDSAMREARRHGAGAPGAKHSANPNVHTCAAALRHEHEGLRVGPFGRAPGQHTTSDVGAERKPKSLKRRYRRVGAARDFMSSRLRDEAGQLRDGDPRWRCRTPVQVPSQSSMAATKNTDSAEFNRRLANSACTSWCQRAASVSCADRRRTMPGYPVRSRRVTVVAWLHRYVIGVPDVVKARGVQLRLHSGSRGIAWPSVAPVPPCSRNMIAASIRARHSPR